MKGTPIVGKEKGGVPPYLEKKSVLVRREASIICYSAKDGVWSNQGEAMPSRHEDSTRKRADVSNRARGQGRPKKKKRHDRCKEGELKGGGGMAWIIQTDVLSDIRLQSEEN